MLTLERIYGGETAELEFKREPPAEDKKWIKTAIAFANGAGGTIVFGVDDKTRRIVGVDPARAPLLADCIANAASERAAPPLPLRIRIQTLEEKTLVLAEVGRGADTPYHFKGEEPPAGVFVRVGATTRPAEREQVRELLLDGSNRTYDELVERGVEPASEAEIEAFRKALLARAKNPGQPVGEAQLVGWRLLRREGGVLMPSVAFRLFARGDLPFARTQCAVFSGTDKVDFLRRLELEGPLHEQVEGAAAFVAQAMPPGARIKGLRREDVYEIPMEAVRELIYNALMHRNYLARGFVQVSVFADRFEVLSPGGLYKGMSREDMLAGVSALRNPVVADVFQRMGFVERWGSGVRRVFDLCRAGGLRPPRVEVSDSHVRVTIVRPTPSEYEEIVHGARPIRAHREWRETDPAEKAAAAAEERMLVREAGPGASWSAAGRRASVKPETLARVLAFVRASPGATRVAAAAALGLSPRTATRALGRLMAEGLVEHRGSDKFGGFHATTP